VVPVTRENFVSNGNAKFLEDGLGLLGDLPVALRAHEYANAFWSTVTTHNARFGHYRIHRLNQTDPEEHD